MPRTIYWRVFIKSTDMDKARSICSSLISQIGGLCQVGSCDVYWKDKSLIEAEISQELSSQDKQSFLIALFKNLSHLSRTWNINMPANLTEENFELSGTSDEILRSEIAWVGFELER